MSECRHRLISTEDFLNISTQEYYTNLYCIGCRLLLGQWKKPKDGEESVMELAFKKYYVFGKPKQYDQETLKENR